MDFTNKSSDLRSLNRSRIYNLSTNKKPAELFRKDLISAMKMSDSEQLNREDYYLVLDNWKTEWDKGVQIPLSSYLDSPSSDDDPNGFKFKELDLVKKNDYKLPKNLIKFDMNPDFYISNYDLDLVDLCWLDSLKESDENIIISENVLSSIMTQFEIQCAAKMNAKKESGGCDDHVLCDVCKSPDGEDLNEMVFCDSCNICVHQYCYGIKDIPSGEWHCNPCKELGSKKNVVCVLCPNIGGAFKPTTNAGQWSHVSCALWIPEIKIGDVELMEPICGIDQIPSSRWNLLCYLCNIKQGTPIQCSEKGCKVAYHVTCAFNHKLKMKAIVEKNKTGCKLKSFCRKHSEEKQKEDNNKKKGNESINSNIEEIDLVINPESSLENSNLEFWQYVDLDAMSKQLLSTIKDEYPKLSTKTHQLYLDLMYQYWKIKRYSQFGAPLIKITTSSSLEEMQLQQRIEILRLRIDLERIRNLAYMLIKREKLKKTWLNTHKNLVDKSIHIAENINRSDSLNVLKNNYKPESPIQTKDFQHHLRILENLNTIHESIDLNNIYDSASNEVNKVKFLLKRLNKLSKIEKTNEHLNEMMVTKSNPYARSYLKRDGEDSEYSYSSEQQHIKTTTTTNNQYFKISSTANNTKQHHQQPKSYPLKSKSIPSNLKNSSHHLIKSSGHDIKYNNNNNSKFYESHQKNNNVKKNNQVRSNSLARVCKNNKISPKSLVKKEIKSSKKTHQENLTRLSRKFNHNLDLSPNSKKNNNNIHRKIPTRSHFNTNSQLQSVNYKV